MAAPPAGSSLLPVSATATVIQPLTRDELQSAVTTPSKEGVLDGPSRYVLEVPGKLLRSRLVLEAAACGPHPDDPFVREAAKAVELFHVATLVHDDVIDHSPLRRGRPTLGARFGAFAPATTAGWLFARAANSAARCGDEALQVLAETACAVVEGEMLETQDVHNVNRSVDRYEQAIAGKTAALFACAARLGAHVAGADRAIADVMEDFGFYVGMAFQLADDVLDLVGGYEVTGKRPGDDLCQGVYTLPVIHAMTCDTALRERLERGVPDEQVGEVIAVVDQLGGVTYALGRVQRYADAAKAIAGDVPGAQPLLRYVDDALARCPTGARE